MIFALGSMKALSRKSKVDGSIVLDKETRLRLMEQNSRVAYANRLESAGDVSAIDAFKKAAAGEQQLANFHLSRGDTLRASQALLSALGCWFHAGCVEQARAAGLRALGLQSSGNTAEMVRSELKTIERVCGATSTQIRYREVSRGSADESSQRVLKLHTFDQAPSEFSFGGKRIELDIVDSAPTNVSRESLVTRLLSGSPISENPRIVKKVTASGDGDNA